MNKVVLLDGISGLSLNMVNETKKIRSTWPDKNLTIEILDSFSMAELYERVTQLPATTATLMLAIHNDCLGHYFSYSDDLKKLANKSAVPIYDMWRDDG